MGRRELREGLRRSLSSLLGPLFFARKRFVWSRATTDFVDVIEVVFGKTDTQTEYSFTVSVGVCWPKAYEACWGKKVPAEPSEVDCTVRTRVGALAHAGHDVWWMSAELSDEAMADGAHEGVATHALPFLERMHSVDELERFLAASARKFTYPPEVIYRAVLLREQGRTLEARRILEQERPRLGSGTWGRALDEILASIG